MARSKKSLVDKLTEHFDENLVDTITAESKDELKNRLARLAQNEAETELARSQDERLQTAKETVKELGAPYKETLQGISLQRKYVAERLESVG